MKSHTNLTPLKPSLMATNHKSCWPLAFLFFAILRNRVRTLPEIICRWARVINIQSPFASGCSPKRCSS
ncbi:uncharacterized protein DS421_18g634710 [Arachis hypogaea]|nr:uncharacterized protein DS421_18g634710 [Arachis hypogaea]